MRAEIKVSGVVQGVGFRPFIYRLATANNLKGFVRNCGDAGVEIVVEGTEDDVRLFVKQIKKKKPLLAHVHEASVRRTNQKGSFAGFTIHKSSGTRKPAGSVIPPDIATCKECLNELRNPANLRHDYFFITCTDCGPRYTAIRRLPYDRQNTTMQDFEMCERCGKEYADPTDRRFHAQTLACPKCGPKAKLTADNGKPLSASHPIREAGRLLAEGYIVAIKGYGGFHVATSVTRDEPISRLRQAKHRREKPFAIMARDLETTRIFARVSSKEAEILDSHTKPVVLLEKAEEFGLSELIAPGLHNVGVMLPYSGLHVMLFDRVKEPAFVMTSANPPSEPIVVDDAEALRKLSPTVDYFLFHNREIAQRCDDSVIRLHNEDTCFIRRSRGYAPAPITLGKPFEKCVLGVGAQENVTSCILWRDRAFMSPYIGDVENVETFTFLKRTIRHLLMLTNTKIDVVSCDLHPGFASARLARDVAEEMRCPILPVQHHHAHTLSLMGEHNLDEIIGIVCDGYGYGTDGKAWGGEILYDNRGHLIRCGHLQEQPMIGGDLATRYPVRMAAGILNNAVDLEDWCLANSKYFPNGRREAQMVLYQLNRKHTIPTTTSCGRILDAVSAVLGICFERTYQGEPAMKLESAAANGDDVLKLEPEASGGILQTTRIVRAVFEARNTASTADLAYSAQSYLAKGLAQLAIEAAARHGVKSVGLSGGVAYNRHITLTVREQVERNGLAFYVHKVVPAGDGGISFGQAIAGANSESPPQESKLIYE